MKSTYVKSFQDLHLNPNNIYSDLRISTLDFISHYIVSAATARGIQDKEEPNMTDLRSPGRGLRSAYNTDEPEYTPAQLDLYVTSSIAL